jgi:hypothetical protein
MRILSIMLGLVLLLGLSACDTGSLENEASSELFVYNNLTGALIADGDQRGAITMQVGDTRQLRVMRRVSDPDEGTITTNVTNDADYNTSNDAVANVGDNTTAFAGVITAVSPGTASIEVAFHDPEDPTKTDDAFLDVLVTQ